MFALTQNYVSMLNIRQEDIVGPRLKHDVSKYCLSQRTINEWNRLPGDCVNVASVSMLKNKTDDYF